MWYDYIIDIVMFCCDEWIGKVVFIFFDVFGYFVCVIQIFVVDDFCSVFGIYYGDFGCWLGIVYIVVQVF